MVDAAERTIDGTPLAPAVVECDHASIAPVDRHRPFLLRVAVEWTNIEDVPSAGEGAVHVWRRAPLTGSLTSTSRGADVSFSDLEV